MTSDRKEYFKQWYLKNKKRILVHQKKYHQENREWILLRQKEYELRTRVERYEQQRRWREQRRLKNLKPYTEISKRTKYNHTTRFGGIREKVIQRDREKCRDCGLTRERHKIFYGVDITVHHLNYKGRNSKNPEHKEDELLTLCLRCHGKRDVLRK
ncbi:MAG: hypothetical protein WC549_00275 [Actinomycetota bacterium]